MINIRDLIVGIAVASMLTVAGCAGDGRESSQGPKPLKMPPRPADPPAVPARQSVEIDPQLVTSARQEIRSAFESNDPVIRANAIEAAQDTLGPQARDMILRGLRDSDALVRFSAAMSAGKLRLKEAYQPLLKMLEDPSTRVRIGVRYALHRLGDKRFTHYLEQTARDPNKYVRGQTSMVLGMLEEPSALRILRQLSNDPEPVVRFQVAEAMWLLGDEQGLNALVAGTVSHFPDDQVLCVLALAGPKDRRVLEHMRGRLTTDWDEVNLAAARAMGELGSDEGYGVAIKGAKSADPRQRVLAALAFGAIGRSDAQPYLAPLLRDSNQSVRLAAATAILELNRSSVTHAQ